MKLKKLGRKFYYAEQRFGKVSFGVGLFPRSFSLGILMTRYMVSLNLGFIWFDIDWFEDFITDFNDLIDDEVL